MRARIAVLSLLLLASCSTPALRPIAVLGSRIISVPDDFPSIQTAVDSAVDGDIVFVHEGIWGENVAVNKAIALVGENLSTTFIDGRNITAAITFTANRASVTGFTIENGGSTVIGAGILVSGVQYVNMSHNVIMSSYSGVSLVNSSMNVVQNNFISVCNFGLSLDVSGNNLLTENTVANATSSGIYVQNSPENKISGNALVGGVIGADFVSSSNIQFENNTVTRNSMYGLKADSSPNCTVERNSLSQNTGEGLHLYSSANCRIDGNSITSNDLGVLVQSSNNVTFTGNAIGDNQGDGIYITDSQSNAVQTNNISKNGGNGLVFQFADFGIAFNNYVGNNTQNGMNFYTSANGQVVSNVIESNGAGLLMQSCRNSTVSGNEVRGNTRQGILLTDSAESTVSVNSVFTNGWEGLALQNSANSTAKENAVCGNGRFGIWLQDSPSIEILRCNVSSNGQGGAPWDGIYLKNSNGSRILNSTINANGDAGSRVYYTDNVTLAGNNITQNGDGLRVFISNYNAINGNNISLNIRNGINVFNSTGNLIYNNVFFNNSVNVLTQGSVNAWDNGYPDGGNYWSNYNGTDTQWGTNQSEAGRDDVGDEPYVIDQENVDRYPLVSPSRSHDLTFEHVSSTPNEVYIGWIFETEMTITNTGGYVETFNLTSYRGDEVIETHIVNDLTVGANCQVTLTWKTSDFRPCTTLGVMVKISRDESEALTGDGTYDLGRMKVKLVGDVNADGKVDVFDVGMIDTAFGSTSGETPYRLSYDMNNDGVINILDIGLTAKNFGNTCP